jgi:hypothetical protein
MRPIILKRVKPHSFLPWTPDHIPPVSSDHRYLADKTKAPPLSARTEVALTRPGLTVFTRAAQRL